LALGCLGAAAVAHAELSGTVTPISEYDFRGASQTARDPAIQGSIDYTHESGWSIGAWASNVDFGNGTDYELDLYGGFSGETESGLGWDAGFIYYTYEDSDINYPEIYAGLSYSWFSGRLYYSNDFGGSDESAWYLPVDASIPLPANLTLNLHVGYNFGDFWDAIDSEYFDYSAGVGYSLGHFDLSLKYVDTDLKQGDGWYSNRDLFNTEGRVIFGISTTFPWGE